MKRLALLLALSLSSLALAEDPPATAEPAPAPTPAPMHPQGIEKIPVGVIEGGWGYVYACWGLALGGAALYALSLYLRRPGAQS